MLLVLTSKLVEKASGALVYDISHNSGQSGRYAERRTQRKTKMKIVCGGVMDCSTALSLLLFLNISNVILRDFSVIFTKIHHVITRPTCIRQYTFKYLVPDLIYLYSIHYVLYFTSMKLLLAIFLVSCERTLYFLNYRISATWRYILNASYFIRLPSLP